MKATESLMNILIITLCGLLTGAEARASDVSGQWRGEFDSQIGRQKYAFAFQVIDGKMAAKATAEVDGQKREVEFKETKLAGDTLTFVELRQIQDNTVRIEYTGKVRDSEIKFTRKVGDFATQEFVAKREPATAQPAAAPGQRGRGGRGGFGGPITLGPDDKPAFPTPAEGFDKTREGIEHGKLEMVEYDSKSVGNKRTTLVYTGNLPSARAAKSLVKPSKSPSHESTNLEYHVTHGVAYGSPCGPWRARQRRRFSGHIEVRLQGPLPDRRRPQPVAIHRTGYKRSRAGETPVQRYLARERDEVGQHSPPARTRWLHLRGGQPLC